MMYSSGHRIFALPFFGPLDPYGYQGMQDINFTSGRVSNIDMKAHRRGRNRKRSNVSIDPIGVPTLSRMKNENRRKARQHFRSAHVMAGGHQRQNHHHTGVQVRKPFQRPQWTPHSRNQHCAFLKKKKLMFFRLFVE